MLHHCVKLLANTTILVAVLGNHGSNLGIGQPAVGINDPFIKLEFSDLTVGIHGHFTNHGESIHLGIQ